MTPKPDPFFLGYARSVPAEIRAVAMAAAAGLLAVLAVLAVLLPFGIVHPGTGRYADDLRGGTLTGVIDPLPYPILRIPATDTAPARAVLLGGQDKIGAQGRVGAADPFIAIGGIFVKRGDLEMLLVNGRGGVSGTGPAEGFTPAPAVDLGRWRLTGEICDGKCHAGAMKPGDGLAHKACANLCISGGLPPVLVMERPVEGSTVVVIAAADGGPMPAAFYDLVAIPLQLEGQLERRDDLLIFRVDATAIRKL